MCKSVNLHRAANALKQSAKELADNRKTFHKSYMEYVSKLNDIEAKKKVDYMENVSDGC